MKKSQELGLVTMYASYESFEFTKRVFEEMGYNPFVSSYVLNGIEKKFAQSNIPANQDK